MLELLRKIEIRINCKECGEPIKEKRFRTYCSKKCREKFTNKKFIQKNKEWQQNNRGKYEEGKIQCIVCDKWYHQVCSHACQVHGLSSIEYKELAGKNRQKGILSQETYEVRRKKNLETKDIVWENLKEGKKFWFKKGDHSIGRYERRPETVERLKNNKFKTIN